MIPRRASLALDLLSLAYPALALLLVKPLGAGFVVFAIIAVLVLRAATGLGRKLPVALTLATLAAALTLAGISLIDPQFAMRMHPVTMNAVMLLVFGWSLHRPPSMIERLARTFEGDLPESGIRYTRKVTWVWCGFFVLNGAVAFWTVLTQPLEVWALYNGVISYVLMGLLFAGEFLVRRRVRANEQSGKATVGEVFK